MAFDPMRLPERVLEAYKWGVGARESVVYRAIWEGMDANTIGNIVFYLHHPERIGYPIQPGETSLIQEWKTHRDYAQGRMAWAVETAGKGYVLDRARSCWPCGIEGTDVPG